MLFFISMYSILLGVPLIDGGTVRLPKLIGYSRAMDLILTGRAVSAKDAMEFGLVSRVVATGTGKKILLGLLFIYLVLKKHLIVFILKNFQNYCMKCSVRAHLCLYSSNKNK
jgi:enoyl-CoA hydratase/carnithine racemase